MVKRRAKPRYPIPEIRPDPMARNSMVISRAVPGAERKRTRLNAPATATPAPTLPLTIMMTTQTTAGRSASVRIKLLVNRERYMYVNARIRPISREQPIQSRKSGMLMTAVILLSKSPLKNTSVMAGGLLYFGIDDGLIGSPVF